ncbi:MAG: HutD family protein [Crocinitomicaceae bacterium]
MKHIQAFAHTTSKWDGGTTTELFIWPDGSSYAKKNFDFRISTATVLVDESVFTSLPGIQRTLMLLKGSLELQHEGHHQIALTPFKVDRFDGGWKTKSKGQCLDFNLMCGDGFSGNVKHLSVDAEEEVHLDFTEEYHFIYVYSGAILCGELEVRAGDLIIIDDEEDVDIWADKGAELVLVEVNEN